MEVPLALEVVQGLAGRFCRLQDPSEEEPGRLRRPIVVAFLGSRWSSRALRLRVISFG